MRPPTRLHQTTHPGDSLRLGVTPTPPPVRLHPAQAGAFLELGDPGLVVWALDRAEGTGRALELDVAAAVAQRAGRDGRSALLPGFHRRALALPARQVAEHRAEVLHLEVGLPCRGHGVVDQAADVGLAEALEQLGRLRRFLLLKGVALAAHALVEVANQLKGLLNVANRKCFLKAQLRLLGGHIKIEIVLKKSLARVKNNFQALPIGTHFNLIAADKAGRFEPIEMPTKLLLYP